MKIAILGDIHGNIEALRTAYDAAVSNNVEKIYHLGDLGGYAPFVNEVVDFLIEHQIEGVQGNYDDAVANGKEHCGCKYEDPVQAEMATMSFEWTKGHATQKSKDYMKCLPFDIEFSVHDKKVKIFHATPLKNNLYWHNDRDEDFFLHMARKADADIMIYGHTHIPYRKNIGNKVFINAGSVGKPKDGDARTCACIADITPDNVKTEFLRIPYDVEKVASAIIESGIPSYFAERLRQGK
ncbi:phosphoesterase [Dissulfurispira thermophila]|uniref:Phosphoesterase n=1 Tax=Dissulfurispira thermophila TaxID=2715679 RepID=A0A7G1GZ14_9BACT|nr:metallophosphoesterase family protein [Dissulfurispira thermophila]BCB95312.1 phosphoesterase [Dissulfurispira thermophila]